MDLNADYSTFHRPLGDADPVSVNNQVIGEIPSFAQGFDRLVVLELALTSLINTAVVAAEGPHSAAVIRLLGGQRERIAAEVGLLSRSCESLPTATPFGKSLQPLSSSIENEHPTVRLDQNGLSEIINLHTKFINTIEVMKAGQPHDIERSVLLKDLAQSHEEMSWMLTALLNEDKTARSREILPAEDVIVKSDNIIGDDEPNDLSDA